VRAMASETSKPEPPTTNKYIRPETRIKELRASISNSIYQISKHSKLVETYAVKAKEDMAEIDRLEQALATA
jgi:hypothetical protein